MNAASGRLAVVWWSTPPFRNGQPTWGGFPCLTPGIGWPRPATACRRPKVHIISYMYFCTFVNQFLRIFLFLRKGWRDADRQKKTEIDRSKGKLSKRGFRRVRKKGPRRNIHRSWKASGAGVVEARAAGCRHTHRRRRLNGQLYLGRE
jgi:hypothetical protein